MVSLLMVCFGVETVCTVKDDEVLSMNEGEESPFVE